MSKYLDMAERLETEQAQNNLTRLFYSAREAAALLREAAELEAENERLVKRADSAEAERDFLRSIAHD